MMRTARIAALLVVPAIVVAIASPAHGHARLKSPAPRDNRDGYKDMTPPGTGAPCGIARTASQPSSTLTAGATVTVTWEETVTHPGCFVIDFSAANDGNFQVIGRKSHMNAPAPNPTAQSPRQWSMSVTLPSAPCTACTLRLRQMMLNTGDVSEANLATGCPPATIPNNATYYSCANVVLGGGGASGSGGSGGTTGSGGTGGGAGGAGGRGGSSASGRGGTTATAGTSGQAGSGSGAAGSSGQAGDTGTPGQAGDTGTSGQAGDTGTSGQAGDTGTSGQAGSAASGQAGNTSSGQAGTGTSGAAGSSGSGQSGTSGGGGEASGGCGVAGGAPAPLAVLIGLALLRRARRRSRS
jgi:hypothetical protein